MASALERATQAVMQETARQDDIGTFRPELIARAVLMAVRAIDGYGIEMEWWSERIVDAILKEKDTTND